MGLPPVPESSEKDEPLPSDSNDLSDIFSALSDRTRARFRRFRAHERAAAFRDRTTILKAAAHDNDVRARAARAAVRQAAADAMPELHTGSGSEDEGGDEGPSAYATFFPASSRPPRIAGPHPTPPTPAPDWLLRTREFGGVPLGLGEQGIWVAATTTAAKGRSASQIAVPNHFNMAKASADWTMWEKAIDAELAQMEVRKAFTTVLASAVGNNILISTTWVFTVKDDVDPITKEPLLKFKARLTARGDLVDPSRINPDQLNAPTIDPECVRLILALVAADPLCKFIQSDIVAAYLNVLLKKHEAPIFLMAPQGMHGVPAGHVLQLNINLYGLCEAAWRWYMDLSSTMATQGWTKSNFESCLWHRQDDPKDKASKNYFLLHVDDSITVGRNARTHYDRLAAHYEMKDMGVPTTWCGIGATDGLFLSLYKQPTG